MKNLRDGHLFSRKIKNFKSINNIMILTELTLVTSF